MKKNDTEKFQVIDSITLRIIIAVLFLAAFIIGIVLISNQTIGWFSLIIGYGIISLIVTSIYKKVILLHTVPPSEEVEDGMVSEKKYDSVVSYYKALLVVVGVVLFIGIGLIWVIVYAIQYGLDYFHIQLNSVTGWIIVLIVLLLIDLLRSKSLVRSISSNVSEKKSVKNTVLAIVILVSILAIIYYLVIPWWNNRPTSPDTPIQYTSHSVTTGTLQTQHVSTASEVTTVPRENISTPVPLTLEHEYTLEPGTEYEWYNDSTKKYFLPVDCGTEMKLFVYTGDRSTHYIYEAERDTYGNVSEGKYDLVTPNRVPAGYFRIQLLTPDPIKVKYTAYLK